MGNNDYNEPRRDYFSPEEENDFDRYNRPNYETAEEYNKARSTQSYYSAYEEQDAYHSQAYENTQYTNLDGKIVDGDGKPLRNNFAIQMVFSIVEIVSCCTFNIVSGIMGTLGLIFATQANTAYNKGDKESFKSKSAVANVLLIIGGVWMALGVVMSVVFSSLLFNFSYEFIDAWSGIINEYEYLEENLDSEFNDDSYYGEYIGTDEEPLAEGFEEFTYKGVSYSLPMDYADFAAWGYEIDKDFDESSDKEQDGKVDANDYAYVSFFGEDGLALGTVGLFNYSDKPLLPEECLVGEITIYNEVAFGYNTTSPDFTFCGGLTLKASYEDIVAFLGDPTYAYHSDETDEYAYYSWYYWGENNEYQCVDISFWEGVISSVSIEFSYDN